MSHRAGLVAATVVLLVPLLPERGGAQESPRDPVATTPDSGGAKVLVFGTTHLFRHPELVEGPERQRQMRAVAEALAEFRPTKVLVEEEPADSARMDSLYRAYRSGRHELSANERQQIGFRLARMSDLDRLWAVDYQHPWPMDKVTSFASRHDSAYMAYRTRWKRETAAMRDSIRQEPLSELFRFYNSHDLVAHVQALRMRTMEVDARGTWVGLEPNESYWKRNMRIFADIAAHAGPGERIVVIYGAGHGYFLRKWTLQHPRMELVETTGYLPSATTSAGEQAAAERTDRPRDATDDSPPSVADRPRDPVATTPDSGGAKLMVLGSPHFYQLPGLVEGPEQQAELDAVLEGLAEFRPTKVLVEEEPADSARMDSLFRAWRDGRWEMAPNERYQVGFRLAARADLDRVWAVDYQHPWPMDKVTSFASRYDSAYTGFMGRWQRETAAMRKRAESGSLAEMYRFYNRPELLAHVQAMRMRTMEVDARGTWVGLEPNEAYWKRNMRIFADIAAHAEPGERIFVVFGVGHAYFFRKWALQHPRIELVDPRDYLP